MYNYLVDMIFAQNYASLNRLIMIRQIVEGLGIEFNNDNTIETIHNYIDFKRMIIRKGAISAEKDEICIISLNMRDGILICKGKALTSNFVKRPIFGETSFVTIKSFVKETSNFRRICRQNLDEVRYKTK